MYYLSKVYLPQKSKSQSKKGTSHRGCRSLPEIQSWFFGLTGCVRTYDPRNKSKPGVVKTWKWSEEHKRFIHGEVVQGTDFPPPLSLRDDGRSAWLTAAFSPALTRKVIPSALIGRLDRAKRRLIISYPCGRRAWGKPINQDWIKTWGKPWTVLKKQNKYVYILQGDEYQTIRLMLIPIIFI